MSLNIVRHRFWSPPPVERVASMIAVTTAAARLPFEANRHFRLVTREPGSERLDLPIWAPTPNAVLFDESSWGPVVRHDVPGVAGAFVLSHVLTEAECQSIADLSEAMGYTEDAPVSLGRTIRHNENCVLVADETLWRPIWARVREHMPGTVAGGAPAGLNQRWRLYKYASGDVFRMHTDGAWPGSGLDGQGRLVRDAFGDRWSQMTFLIYLDGDYDGGETTFFVADRPGGGTGELVSVAVPRGSVLCFFHGEHALSPLHEGALVRSGVKRVVRTDVLYTLPGRPVAAKGEGEQGHGGSEGICDT